MNKPVELSREKWVIKQAAISATTIVNAMFCEDEYSQEEIHEMAREVAREVSLMQAEDMASFFRQVETHAIAFKNQSDQEKKDA